MMLANIKHNNSCILIVQRLFHVSPCLAVDKAVLGKLRKKTGFALSQCKKALEIHESDFEKAEEWLQKEAQAQGWAKATKLSGRATTQGLIGVHVERGVAGLVEMNCETDFVARNEEFRSLLTRLTRAFTNSSPLAPPEGTRTVKETVDSDILCALKTEEGQLLSDLVALSIGKIGENIRVKRGVRFGVAPGYRLVAYTHPPSESARSGLGRYGAVVAFKNAADDTLVRELCAHIVGMNPKSIGSYDGPPAAGDEGEEAKAPLRSSEDSDDEDGREPAVKSDSADKPLVYQDFISDQETLVGQVLLDNDMEILDFVRLECGETHDS